MSSNKVAISALPIPPPSHLITHNLVPDPLTTSVSHFRSHVLRETPSIQRRARLLSPESHFSYVTPFPTPFPYQIQPPESQEDLEMEDKSKWVETWLSKREAVNGKALASNKLQVYMPENRDQPRELIGLAKTGLEDCLPHLDVGDGFSEIGSPALKPIPEDGPVGEDTAAVAARQELVDVLSGHATVMSAESTPDDEAFAPWSIRYSGHQFGSWAGQLGDGRAISILVTPHPSSPDLTYELQLKGGGRTPFSRSADGLAVLRSSIREFLCSEAMHALHIPTTRSLSLISLPSLPVERERVETACVLTRMAPSFLRIGSFEALSSPGNMFFFGGGQQVADWDALRILGEWVSKRVLKLDLTDGEPWGKKLVLEVARRNAVMVAGWQAYGFMHGVMNTDNISILGLTIDYGPYAFMDVFDPFHICNHTDQEGRYAYMYQPNMIVYALRALLTALAPLIGAEAALGKAVGAGWAKDVPEEKITEWRENGQSSVKENMEKVVQEVSSVEYGKILRQRLALRRQDLTDETQLFRPLLKMMENHKLDFHLTFRKLSTFRPSWMDNSAESPSSELENLVSSLLTLTPDASHMDYPQATKDWMSWFEKYAQRIRSEEGEWAGEMDVERDVAAKKANPRFILRQWLLEEVIAKVEKDPYKGKRILAKVLHMACNPFEPWGAEGEESDQGLDPEVAEERRFCGMGEKKMLGFQCSCSS